MSTTLYHARRVIAQDDGPDPEAFAVGEDRIVATGDLAELRDRFPTASVLDLGAATVIPGLHDAHAHLAMTAEDVLHLDLSARAVPDLDALLARVRDEAARTPDAQWVRGSRFDDHKTGRLTRDALDTVAPDNPVLVVHVAGHWGVVNSAALAALDIDEDSPDPEGGNHGRYPDGRLDGRLVERALLNRTLPATAKDGPRVPVSTPEELAAGAVRASHAWNAAGLTSVCDALVGPEDVAVFASLRDAGDLTLRLSMLLSIDRYDAIETMPTGDDWLRLLGVKMFLDGAVGGRTCMIEGGFPDGAGEVVQTTSTEKLMADVARVHADGVRIGVHANGDEAIRIVLDAYEQAQAARPDPALRHRIEHCSLVDDDILRRMAALGTIAVPFAGYAAYHGGALLDWYGDRVSRMFAHRSFLDAGITVGASSDYPCGPIEPLLGIQSLVTRTGIDDGVVVGAEQRITPAEALAVFTLGSAAACGEEDRKGRIAPGYLADFVALGEDPLTADPDTIAGIEVQATYVGGRAVYKSSDR